MVEAVVDACCALNLAAAGSGDPMAILPQLNIRLHIPKIVLTEPRFLWRVVDDERIDLAVDFTPAVEAGWVIPCEIETPGELDLFVELAARLKDPDAACLTIALSRHMKLATDDGKILRIAREYGTSTATTPALLRDWAEAKATDRDAIARAIRSVETLGNYRPKAGNPFYEWWMDLSGEFGDESLSPGME